MSFILQSHTSEQTFDYGSKLASFLQSGDLISLTGELGAGKTVFTKGLAKGLGIDKNILSPTFIIIREYKGRLPLYHFDVYRINSEDLTDLGYEDYFYSNGVIVVEWGDKIKDKLPADFLEIRFSMGIKKNERTLEFKVYGNFANRFDKIKRILSNE